ncbi:hypothetical protein RHMOL_Rhmol04G0252500 [Rhododendron molle]|uniref:Uncharacterized protein n=1 Tax=Rhododendron molle TaxID=49168 RepID=A0ACC0P5Y3_RHOML|nr:hypothetical protein RHMOL_Rhmol04G0252500 [Rhododendron molle]
MAIEGIIQVSPITVPRKLRIAETIVPSQGLRIGGTKTMEGCLPVLNGVRRDTHHTMPDAARRNILVVIPEGDRRVNIRTGERTTYQAAQPHMARTPREDAKVASGSKKQNSPEPSVDGRRLRVPRSDKRSRDDDQKTSSGREEYLSSLGEESRRRLESGVMMYLLLKRLMGPLGFRDPMAGIEPRATVGDTRRIEELCRYESLGQHYELLQAFHVAPYERLGSRRFGSSVRPLGFPPSRLIHYIRGEPGKKSVSTVAFLLRNPILLLLPPPLLLRRFPSTNSSVYSMVDSRILPKINPEGYPNLMETIQSLDRNYRSFNESSSNFPLPTGPSIIPGINVPLQMDDSACRGTPVGQGNSPNESAEHDSEEEDRAERMATGTQASASTSSGGPPSASDAGGANATPRDIDLIPPPPTGLGPMPYNNFFKDEPGGFTKEF